MGERCLDSSLADRLCPTPLSTVKVYDHGQRDTRLTVQLHRHMHLSERPGRSRASAFLPPSTNRSAVSKSWYYVGISSWPASPIPTPIQLGLLECESLALLSFGLVEISA